MGTESDYNRRNLQKVIKEQVVNVLLAIPIATALLSGSFALSLKCEPDQNGKMCSSPVADFLLPNNNNVIQLGQNDFNFTSCPVTVINGEGWLIASECNYLSVTWK